MTPIVAGERVAARMSSSARRSSSLRSPPTPKTARMITSSVTSCIDGWIGNGVPVGHPSISRSVASSMTFS